MFALPHDARLIVCDGCKALFLRNAGTAFDVDLRVEQVLRDDNPLTREQGSDRPGRAFSSIDNRRSGMGETDWHSLAEQRFVCGVAAAIQDIVRSADIQALVIVAPARSRALLRHELDRDVLKRIIGEIEKDLTNHPVPEIARLIMRG
ncbi:MAG TPA: host attachment family protein [Xanthobacteraceae bacterium]|jgi:protein required for attachment to host cells|nr:host attachment family protein [Xanthobacteraceae bacterium]